MSIRYRNFVSLFLKNNFINVYDAFKKEKNIILISEFNKIVNNQIKNQPALFVYEKIGVKYKHFLLMNFRIRLNYNGLI